MTGTLLYLLLAAIDHDSEEEIENDTTIANLGYQLSVAFHCFLIIQHYYNDNN